MPDKSIWSRIFIGFAWTVCLGGLVTLMSFIEIQKEDVICKGVKVYIPGNQYFIDQQEIDEILQVSSHTLVGRKLEKIDIQALENKLRANPFVEAASVYMEMDGMIKVEVSQRQPILRVINRFDQDFYVDQHGLKMPLSKNFTARVLVANGYIDELFANRIDTLHTKLAMSVYKTADFIRRDSLWDAQVAQIYVNETHEIELIPRVGNQRILLGNADSLDIKFRNLAAFYKQALPKVGWDKYKMISIKFSNQVIGIKVDSLANLKQASAPVTVKADTTKTTTTVKDTSQIKQH